MWGREQPSFEARNFVVRELFQGELERLLARRNFDALPPKKASIDGP
jgi:hypothetical protein